MTEEIVGTKCDQENCKVHETGKCLEGFDVVEECPHFYLKSESEILEKKERAENLISPGIHLFHGDVLSLNDINIVTYRFQHKLIIIVGESDCGKTTLLATLYDLLQIGPFNQHLFAGSTTQIGFEIRCHLSRAASEATKPATEKTKTMEFNFLHLALKDKNSLNKSAKHLLLSDVSGERIQLAINYSSEMQKLSLLKTADHITYLIDGFKLADPMQKLVAIMNAKMFIQRGLDVGVINSNSKISIVFSKWDLLEGPKSGVYDQVKNSFIDEFSTRVKEIIFLKLAARPEPPTDSIPLGWGLNDLLINWLTEVASDKDKTDVKRAVMDEDERYFHHYMS